MSANGDQSRLEVVEIARAWLVSWRTMRPGADRHGLAAVFPGRKGASFIRDRVREIYVAGSETFALNVSSAKGSRRGASICEVQVGQTINEVPHGDRVYVLANPGVYARVVSKLRVVREPFADVERVSWIEPASLRWRDKSKLEWEVAERGKQWIVEVGTRGEAWPAQGRTCAVISVSDG